MQSGYCTPTVCQRDASIADQFRICREFAQRQGWHIAAENSDHAVSGATIMRPGFQAMKEPYTL